MKKIILLLLLTSFCQAQTAIYNKTKEAGIFTEYQTKSGRILKVGDTIVIGYPRFGNAFTFITQGGQTTTPMLSNKKVVIHKIKSIEFGNEFKIYPTFKGYGLVPVFIDYEAALETGEIKNPFEISQ